MRRSRGGLLLLLQLHPPRVLFSRLVIMRHDYPPVDALDVRRALVCTDQQAELAAYERELLATSSASAIGGDGEAGSDTQGCGLQATSRWLRSIWALMGCLRRMEATGSLPRHHEAAPSAGAGLALDGMSWREGSAGDSMRGLLWREVRDADCSATLAALSLLSPLQP